MAFEREVNQADSDISLARAALILAAFEYPDLAVNDYIGRIDALTRAAKTAIDGQASPPLALADFLFGDIGFAGNTHDYGDPRNSFLNQVLERRLGIPITLSVVYLEVTQRLGLRAQGVGLLVLNPSDAAEVRNLGLLYANTGRRHIAIDTLTRYLSLAPSATDRDAIKQLMSNLIAGLSRLN